MSILDDIRDNLIKGKAKIVTELVQQAIGEGIDAKTILEKGLLEGMNVVGEKFQKNEVYVPEVLVAARAMNKGTEILKPFLAAAGVEAIGKVCIGTVKGDLHDIGHLSVHVCFLRGHRLFFCCAGYRRRRCRPEAYVRRRQEERA